MTHFQQLAIGGFTSNNYCWTGWRMLYSHFRGSQDMCVNFNDGEAHSYIFVRRIDFYSCMFSRRSISSILFRDINRQ